MSKLRRQFLIKEIIARKSISQQEELLSELRSEGEDINQATLSRDLRELGASRTQSADGPRYTLPAEAHALHLQTMLSYEISSIKANETMVIVNTLTGRAQGVAEQIDHLKLPEILATLAGDNTIFIAPVSVHKTKALEQKLKKLLIEPNQNS